MEKKDNKKKCAICYTDTDEGTSSILAMGGFGNPRYLCPECEALIDNLTLAGDYEKFSEAKSSLAARFHQHISDDTVTFEAVCDMFDRAEKRATQIKEGTYDFSLDEQQEEKGEFDDIPEDLKETEEDRKLDERDEQINKKTDKILNWTMLGVFVGVIGFFVYYFFFR